VLELDLDYDIDINQKAAGKANQEVLFSKIASQV
jgi:hypothetical protein